MASTYTSDLRLNKQGIGDNNNTWGTIVNTQLDLLDDAISGMVTVNITTASNVTLSTANGTSDDARKMILKLSGTPTANINVIVPAVSKLYIIEGSNFNGNFTVTIKPTAGNGVTFNAGECGVVVCDGTDVLEIVRKTDTTPTGEIKMFSGTIASALIAYPGWAFCDGTSGTPDLRDRFVVAARQDSVGQSMTNLTGTLTKSGGSLTSSSNGGESLTTGGTALTLAQIPNHSHDYVGITGTAIGDQNGGSGLRSITTGTLTTTATGSGQVHTHTVTTSNHTHTVTPPYFALVFLMKL
jgi:hypothetical protein